MPIHLVVVNRPPMTSVLKFGEDLADYMEKNINSTGKLVLTGNFNILVSNKSNTDSIIFHDILDSFGLVNCVLFLTQGLQNMLDLVIIQADSNFITKTSPGRPFSDHNYVFYNVTSAQHLVSIHISATRKIKAIDIPAFTKDIQYALQDVDLTGLTPERSLHLYNKTLSSTLDKYAPLIIKAISNKK